MDIADPGSPPDPPPPLPPMSRSALGEWVGGWYSRQRGPSVGPLCRRSHGLAGEELRWSATARRVPPDDEGLYETAVLHYCPIIQCLGPKERGIKRPGNWKMPLDHWLGVSSTLQLLVTLHGKGYGRQRAHSAHNAKPTSGTFGPSAFPVPLFLQSFIDSWPLPWRTLGIKVTGCPRESTRHVHQDLVRRTTPWGKGAGAWERDCLPP